MDKKIQKIMQEKIHETMGKVNEITSLINLLGLSSDANSFGYGVMIGRLYNSFYYQSRRILKRDPTEQEFSDFIDLVKQHQSKFLDFYQSYFRGITLIDGVPGSFTHAPFSAFLAASTCSFFTCISIMH